MIERERVYIARQSAHIDDKIKKLLEVCIIDIST